MSYILDALRKAEQKRKLENIPALESAIARSDVSQRRRPWRWLVAVGILLLLAVTLIVFRQPLLARGQALFGGNDAEPSSPVVEQSAAPAANEASKPPVRQAATQPAKSKSGGRRDRPQVDRAGPRAPRREVRVEQPAASRPQSPAAAQNPPAESAGEPATIRSERADTAKQGSSPLPTALQQKLDAVDLSVISFSTDPVKRFVMVGTEILREGDTLRGGIRISQIRKREVLVEIDGQEALLIP